MAQGSDLLKIYDDNVKSLYKKETKKAGFTAIIVFAIAIIPFIGQFFNRAISQYFTYVWFLLIMLFAEGAVFMFSAIYLFMAFTERGDDRSILIASIPKIIWLYHTETLEPHQEFTIDFVTSDKQVHSFKIQPQYLDVFLKTVKENYPHIDLGFSYEKKGKYLYS